MQNKIFASVATTENTYNWNKLIHREKDLYNRNDEIRSPFARDYTRILHSLAYRRLKHKTQVFFNIDNDHICTRMEHVSHVESVSKTIAKHLGLNDELTSAIAIGHDLGHAPFGHQGETVIRKLSEKHINQTFWHEKNGLRFVDNLELLEDNYKKFQNLNLTYAVRDGIISHCGEVDENGLKPREKFIDLYDFKKPEQFQPITWEGCIVKLADKIAYLGRDIEDANILGFLDENAINKLLDMARTYDSNVLNTTVIMHNLIIDVCQNSSPEKGICLSSKFLGQINEVKNFNYKHIYSNPLLEPFKKYSELVITQIFNTLFETYEKNNFWQHIEKNKKYYPTLMQVFSEWLVQFCDNNIIPNDRQLSEKGSRCQNEKIYNQLDTKSIYAQAIIDFISGMTDRFAIKVFNELLAY